MLELLDFVLSEVEDAEDFGLADNDDVTMLGALELEEETADGAADAEDLVWLEGDEPPGVDDPDLPDADEPPEDDDKDEAEDLGGGGVGMATMWALDAGRSSGDEMLSSRA